MYKPIIKIKKSTKIFDLFEGYLKIHCYVSF